MLFMCSSCLLAPKRVELRFYVLTSVRGGTFLWSPISLVQISALKQIRRLDPIYSWARAPDFILFPTSNSNIQFPKFPITKYSSKKTQVRHFKVANAHFGAQNVPKLDETPNGVPRNGPFSSSQRQIK